MKSIFRVREVGNGHGITGDRLALWKAIPVVVKAPNNWPNNYRYNNQLSF